MSAAHRVNGYWPHPAVITENNFRGKSLSNWALNFAVGCTHACRFCYVPASSTNKLAHQLTALGVGNPDEEWGQYAFLRTWDEQRFLASLGKAQVVPRTELKPDGNRAIMLCSTTDAYQLFRHSDPTIQKELNARSRWMVRRALELIRDHSDLRVRILTRSPLAREDFDLYRSFGNRLLFGVSLPTLDDALARIYEPGAPGPAVRLDTLRRATAQGINTYVAMAPTPPECRRSDYHRTLVELKKLAPITIFHEPINIRAENIARIEHHAAKLGVTIESHVLRDRESWRYYAMQSLWDVAEEATRLGLGQVIHPWPDKSLQSTAALETQDEDENLRWLRFFHDAWARVSAWPGEMQSQPPVFLPRANPKMDKKTKSSGPDSKDLTRARTALKLLRPIRDIAEYLGVPIESIVTQVQTEDPNVIDATHVDAPRWMARIIRSDLTPTIDAPIDTISMQMRFQYRDGVLTRIVDEYAEVYGRDNERVPPIVLWKNPASEELLIIDGFHRVHGCAKAGRKNVPAVVVRCPVEVAALLPVRLNEIHGLKYGQSEKRRALETLFRSDPKLAAELRNNRKGKVVTTDAIGALYGASKATVSRALDDANTQSELEFTPEAKVDHLEYDLSLTLLQARMVYLTKEPSLPVSDGHLRDLAAIHVRLENLLCRLLDCDVRSLRSKLNSIQKAGEEHE